MNSRLEWKWILLVTGSIFLTACTQQTEDLHLNQIQIIGTHNSFHLRPSEGVLASNRGPALDYGHAPLYDQLDSGVRSLAIDIYKGPRGFHVLHIPIIDANTNCETLPECLGEIKRWSEDNRRHIPLIVFLEIKNLKNPTDQFVPMTSEDLDNLENLVWQLLGDRLLTPDTIRADEETLETAILKTNWPSLESVRGRILLQLNGPKALQDHYKNVSPTLAGRSMFLKASPGEPEAAIIVLNDPEASEVNQHARMGYIVRTRADSNVKEAATNDTSKQNAALVSGAHIITTDFPAITPHPQTGYQVALPREQIWRPNPVTAEFERR